MTDQTLQIIRADYGNGDQGKAILGLMHAYACDPMGGGQPLSETVNQQLLANLDAIPGAVTFLAYRHPHWVGLLTAFAGFSTFTCQPLLNIHDVIVLPQYRRQGIAGALFKVVEGEAIARGCCKLTLEVLSGNHSAQRLYSRLGFSDYTLGAEQGTALFWQKRSPCSVAIKVDNYSIS